MASILVVFLLLGSAAASVELCGQGRLSAHLRKTYSPPLGENHTLTCDVPFTLIGPSHLDCHGNNPWPFCQGPPCPLPSIAHGTVLGLRPRLEEMVTLVCEEGFIVHGPRIFPCGLPYLYPACRDRHQ